MDASGVAPRAKIAVFDAGDESGLWSTSGGFMFEAAAPTGARVHSNSWGFTGEPCTMGPISASYDEWAYKVSDRSLLSRFDVYVAVWVHS